MVRKLLVSTLGISIALGLTMAIAWAAPELARRSSAGGAPVLSESAVGLMTSTQAVTATKRITATAEVSETKSVTSTGQAMIAAAIAKQFGVNVADVLNVRAQNLGWGEVFKVFLYAKASGQSPAQIIALRSAGDQGWGVMAKSLGLNPGQGKNNLGQALKDQRTQVQPSTIPDKPKGKKIDPPSTTLPVPDNNKKDNGEKGKKGGGAK